MNDFLQLKKQIAGETKAREAAEARAAAESNRADISERAARNVAADRDRWQARAQRAEAEAASLSAPAA
jgi:hypothetical protein